MLREFCLLACAVCSGNPPHPANGTFSGCGTSSLPGARCNATCDSGFRGNVSATCGTDGTWQAAQSTCTRIGGCSLHARCHSFSVRTSFNQQEFMLCCGQVRLKVKGVAKSNMLLFVASCVQCALTAQHPQPVAPSAVAPVAYLVPDATPHVTVASEAVCRPPAAQMGPGRNAGHMHTNRWVH